MPRQAEGSPRLMLMRRELATEGIMRQTSVACCTGRRTSCMLELMNSLKESSCCRTRPFSSKKALMTAHASSCQEATGAGGESLRRGSFREVP